MHPKDRGIRGPDLCSPASTKEVSCLAPSFRMGTLLGLVK